MLAVYGKSNRMGSSQNLDSISASYLSRSFRKVATLIVSTNHRMGGEMGSKIAAEQDGSILSDLVSAKHLVDDY